MAELRATKRGGARAIVAEPVRKFLGHEASGGVLLLAAAAIAMAWANSPAASSYRSLWTTEWTIGAPPLAVTNDLRHWVNSGLMAVFFFVVSLEIKRELVNGELRRLRTVLLPVGAAVGGVVVPVAIFLAIANDVGRQGWGIPMATDIAFALGVLAILGRRISAGVRLFLLSLAIVDDIIAIMVIALFYSAAMSWAWLLAAAATVPLILLMRRLGVRAIWPYALIGLLMWYATYRSGVHATIAGVALAFLTPVGRFRGRDVAAQLQAVLHPFSAFVVVPVFALANAGVYFGGGVLADAVSARVTWAVTLGLLVGKTVGIGLAVLALVHAGVGRLPNGMRLDQVWGVAALAGIGFTVSLFITDLAYTDPALTDQAKIGIFAGSLASGVMGAAVLALTGRRPSRSEPHLHRRAKPRVRRRPPVTGNALGGRSADAWGHEPYGVDRDLRPYRLDA